MTLSENWKEDVKNLRTGRFIKLDYGQPKYLHLTDEGTLQVNRWGREEIVFGALELTWDAINNQMESNPGNLSMSSRIGLRDIYHASGDGTIAGKNYLFHKKGDRDNLTWEISLIPAEDVAKAVESYHIQNQD